MLLSNLNYRPTTSQNTVCYTERKYFILCVIPLWDLELFQFRFANQHKFVQNNNETRGIYHSAYTGITSWLIYLQNIPRLSISNAMRINIHLPIMVRNHRIVSGISIFRYRHSSDAMTHQRIVQQLRECVMTSAQSQYTVRWFGVLNVRHSSQEILASHVRIAQTVRQCRMHLRPLNATRCEYLRSILLLMATDR